MDAAEKFEILRTEMTLIQAVLDKYDNIAIQTRNWSVTLWAAATGFGLSEPRNPEMHLLALGVVVFALYTEGTIRSFYWQQYVDRYRQIRDALNSPAFDIANFPVYDLTNRYGRKQPKAGAQWKKAFGHYLRPEHSIVYLFLAAASALLYKIF
jgi:uncharacterized membrane protein